LRTASFTPPGVLHNTFHHKGKTYEIWRSNLAEENCREIIARMQILVLLYIEAGSYIDTEDEEWTTRRWDVFFLYQKPAKDQYSFVGYCTLYRYFFFDNSDPDLLRVRLSQFIILPPYQREGHGSRFYDVIMQYYLGVPEVREITIEDPSEDFSDLRDKHDVRRLRRDPEFSALSLEGVVKEKLSTEALRKRSKMPMRQFLRCVEMQLLKTLSPNDSKKRHKMFRLLVKGRIYKQHVDVMAQLDRLERIDKLDETFHHVKDDYNRLVGMMSTSEVESASEVEARAKRQASAADDERPSKRARADEEK
jgi:histone acetyltransferase 1